MGPRIPSSLKWLIETRARLDGEIRKAEKATATALNLLAELKRLQADLSAVDRTLGLHDITVDLAAIQPVLSHSVRVSVPYGELTKSVLLCLRVNSDRPMTTSGVVAFVAARFADLDAPKQGIKQLHDSVRHRLKNLGRQGLLENHRPKNSYGEGLWTIAKPPR